MMEEFENRPPAPTILPFEPSKGCYLLFNSFLYLGIFLPGVALACIAMRRTLGARAAQVSVLVASTIFYAWNKPGNVAFLAGSIVVNWLIARGMSRSEHAARKRLLVLGLTFNVAYLGVFKYFNFFFGILPYFRTHHVLPDIAFPLGISFFTLAQIMYLVDCSDDLLPALSLFDHATFVSFFPYVISGPIAKAKRMKHQFGNFGTVSNESFELLSRGLYLFVLGLFKKVVFAFSFGFLADYGFAVPGRLSAAEAWFFSIAYTLQIYFDFSGYTDMALGSAMMLGIEIPRNFDRPLQSKSIIEFWQRWHISLSNFITSYLYTPILKSFPRINLRNAAIATLIAMGIAGLWHGPRWTFVVFGLLHGAGLVVNQYWRKRKMPRLYWLVSWGITFALVDIAFIFFRSGNAQSAANMIFSLFDPRHAFDASHIHAMGRGFSLTTFAAPLLAGTLLAFYGRSSDQLAQELRPTYRNVLATAGIFVVALIFMNSHISQQFVYFKF